MYQVSNFQLLKTRKNTTVVRDVFNSCLKVRKSIQMIAVDAGLHMKNTWSMKQMQLFSTKLATEMLSTVKEKARSYQTSKIETQRVNIGYGGRENRHRKVIRLGQSGRS